jgi:hypothetical protein
MAKKDQQQQPLVGPDGAAQQQQGEGAPEQTPAIVTLAVPANKGVATLEYNGVESTEAEDQKQALRGFVRNTILRKFGVSQVNDLEVSGGKLKMNGVATSMKLPKLKIDPNGVPTETVPSYYERCKPAIATWLLTAVHNSAITVDQLEAIK